MAKANKPMPSIRARLTIIAEATKNAARQIAAAELLVEHGHFPLANAIATLAGEEVGKAHLCVRTFVNPVVVDAETFWTAFRQHQTKGTIAAQYRLMLGNSPSSEAVRAFKEMEKVGFANDQAKQQGFYVDCVNDQVLTPQRITEQHARRMIENVRSGLEVYLPIADSITSPEVVDTVTRVIERSAETLPALIAEHAKDPAPLLDALRAARISVEDGRGLPPEFLAMLNVESFLAPTDADSPSSST
jgi:AbiV family abortive infection protein